MLTRFNYDCESYSSAKLETKHTNLIWEKDSGYGLDANKPKKQKQDLKKQIKMNMNFVSKNL